MELCVKDGLGAWVDKGRASSPVPWHWHSAFFISIFHGKLSALPPNPWLLGDWKCITRRNVVSEFIPLSPTRFSSHYSTNAWVPPEFEILRTCSMSKHISHSQSTNWKFHSTARILMYSLFYRKPPLDGLFQVDSPIGSFHECPQREPMFHSEE